MPVDVLDPATDSAADPAIPPAAERRDLGTQRRELVLQPGSWNAEARTVEVVWTAGARRATFSWDRFAMVDEELSLDAGAVRLERLNGGAPVLDTHSSYELRNVIGVVVDGSARIEGGQGVATLRLSEREDVAGVVADIAGGIIRNISVGYLVHEYQVTEVDGARPLYRAVDWEPVEISFVPVPADAAAGVRSDAPQGGHPCIIRRAIVPASLEARMPEVVAAPAAEVPAVVPPAATVIRGVTTATLLTRMRAAGLDQAAQDEVIALHDETPLTEARMFEEVGRRYAARDTAATQRSTVQVTRDAGDTIDAAVEAHYLARLTRNQTPVPTGTRSFGGLGMAEIGREWLEAHGVPGARTMSKREVATLLTSHRNMHTTSDFSGLLGNVANKALRAPLVAAPITFEPFVRPRTIRDFKPAGSYQLTGGSELAKVNEAGEFKHGTIGSSGEVYTLETFGRIFALSRQAIINDDLGAFEDLPTMFENLKRTHESNRVYALLTGIHTMGDGVALFNSAHGNLAAAGSAITLTSLNAARAAMSKQVDPSGTVLNIMPTILIVGPDKLLEAEQFVSQIAAQVSGNVNPFAGRLRIVTDARITGNQWFLAADPMASNVGTIELAHLEGEENGVVESKVGFEIDGIAFKVRIDTGVKALDWRGLYKNPGA